MTKLLNNVDVTGYVSQTSVTSSLVKTDSTGKLVAAVAGTDYNAPGVSAIAGTLIREIRNTTGATLTKGTVVYISGATGNKPTVSKAIATGDSTSAQTFGICQADIADNSNGNVVIVGDITGLDTSAFTEGVQLYLSSTTAGTYTATKQFAPAHLVYIGVVTRAHPTQGQIEVKIQNGYELDEIHDVAISSLANNQGLFYESATNLWKNKTIATVLGYTPEPAVAAGTTAQYYRGDKTFQTLNTTAVAEGTNLYYTEGRVTANTDVAANTAARHSAVTLGTANGLSLSTQALSLGLASASANGALSSTDWTTFNNKQNALTNPVTGTGTTNYLPKFTGASTIGNSQIFDNGTNVGINTATPNTSLSIVGNHVSGQSVLKVQSSTAYSSSGLSSIGFNDSDGSRKSIVYTNSDGLQLETSISTPILFNINGGTRMRLDTSGNLGLGVTPSAWFSVFSAIQLGGNFSGTAYAGALAAQKNDNAIVLYNNAFFNTSAVETYYASAEAGKYRINRNQHEWSVAPSGTAGNAISFTQAMTLGSNGNLLLGTTTDVGYKLDVNGTGRFQGSATINGANSCLAVTDGTNTSFIGLASVGGAYGNGTVAGDIVVRGTNGISLVPAAGAFTALRIASTGAATFSSSVTIINQSLKLSNNWNITARNAANTLDLALIGRNTSDRVVIDPDGYGTNIGGGGTVLINPAGGNVGIGTTSPTQLLTLGGAATIQMSLVSTSTTGASEIYFGSPTSVYRGYIGYIHNGDYFTFNTAASEKMRITSGGNVLIGTTTDAGFKLDVSGTGRFSGALSGTSATFSSTITSTNERGFRSSDAVNGGSSWLFGANSGSYYIGVNGGVNALIIANTGAATFSSSVQTTNGFISASYNAGDVIVWGGISPYANIYGALSWDVDKAIVKGRAGYALGLYSDNSATGSKGITILPSGNVGIGTTGAVTRLSLGDYSGARLAYIDGTGNTFNTNGITVSSANSGNAAIGGGLDLTNNTYSVGAYSPIISFSSRSSNGVYNNGYAGIWGVLGGAGVDSNWVVGHLVFGTGGGAGITERMRITSGGNVLIGTTTDSGFMFRVAGTSRFTNIVSIDAGAFGSEGLILNSTTNQQYIAINSATGYEAMTKYFNPTAGNWYTGIRVNAGLGSTASYHIYSSTYGDDTFVLNTNGTARFVGSVQAASAILTQNSNSVIDILTLYNVSATSAGVRLRFQNGYGDLAAISASQIDNGVLADDGQLNFQTASNSVLSTKMTILNGGNVGIGTTTPENYGSTYTVLTLNNASTGSYAVFQYGGVSYGQIGAEASNMVLQAIGSSGMKFTTNSAERMRIMSGGNVLIGTTTDAGFKLDVSGTIRSTGINYASNFYSGGTYNAPNQLVTAGDTNWSYGCFSDNSILYWMQVKFSGTGDDNRGFRVFNINGNTVEFRVNGVGNGIFRGSVTATSFFESSDATIKTLITDNYQAKGIESVVAKLYTKNGKEELGYYAQDVQGILPSAVNKGSDGLLSLSYREVLVAKVQRTETEIDKLKRRVAELEQQLNLN